VYKQTTVLSSALTNTLATLRFYDAAVYNATGSKFVATEHARAFFYDAVLQFSRCRRFSTKVRTKMEKNTISAKELQEKEGYKSG
jgi:hypothetical protein